MKNKNKSYKILRKKTLLKFKYILHCFLKPTKKISFLRKYNIFAELGEHILFQPWLLPNDPQYIKLHNNIAVASGVVFYNHDVINWVLNGRKIRGGGTLNSHIECIEIMDNVFIGGNSIILGGCKIGPEVIVAAGSVVTKDIPQGSVVAGVPARVIGKFEDLVNKRIELDMSEDDVISKQNEEEKILKAWENFYKKHN